MLGSGRERGREREREREREVLITRFPQQQFSTLFLPPCPCLKGLVVTGLSRGRESGREMKRARGGWFRGVCAFAGVFYQRSPSGLQGHQQAGAVALLGVLLPCDDGSLPKPLSGQNLNKM